MFSAYLSKMRAIFLFLLLYCATLTAQNLPSLIKGKNINATFSIVGYDPNTQEWGIAVATNNIYVGNSTIYIQPGLGAFSVIAETEPAYALNGFESLKAGKSIREAIEGTMKNDSEAYSRQVSGIDSRGNCFAFTGSTWKYQKGLAGSMIGKDYVVMGNQLGDSVLRNMSAAFEKTSGTLAERLLSAIVAGEKAGGQITGKQSAALVVKGTRNEWFNNIDLRVDDSRDPFSDLQRLLNYHNGRIRLNQALFAVRMGNTAMGKSRLSQAEKMLKGWNGMQGKIAQAYLLLGDDLKAVAVIRAALKANPKWKENLPAFYLLKEVPGLKGSIHEKTFSEKDWISAVSFLSELNRDTQAISLSKKVLRQFPGSSYLYYLLGKSLLVVGKQEEGKIALRRSISLDPSNAEAENLIKQTR
jgi:uncharacterized Ntn-hydrolase superfamily protein